MSREVETLSAMVERCVTVLEAHAVCDGSRVGWGTWELDEAAEPVSLNASRPALYDGNTGIAWALRLLGSDPGPTPVGAEPPRLLGGAAGTTLASGAALPTAEEGRGNDLGDGLAGDLLALVRSGCGDVERLHRLVRRLDETALRLDDLIWWGDPRPPEGRPLCGLAHGASGVALALAEAAAAHPDLAGLATPLISGALRWESAWHDPGSGWPDLREADGGHPVLWCHGAGGVGATRLRLLQLVASGLRLDYPTDALAAEASESVIACGRVLTQSAQIARQARLAAVPQGLTLCHGLGGPLDVLVQAAEVWGEPSRLQAARRIAVDLLATAPADPLEWPSGLKAPGCLGLFVGLAGTALVLARLADPTRIGPLGILAPQRN